MADKRITFRDPRRHDRRAFPKHGEDERLVLFGIHAIEAALRNPKRTVGALFLTENAERRLAEAIAARGVSVSRATPRDLDRRLGADTVHQGALMETSPLPVPPLEDLVARAAAGPIVALDQITDPHNVGAILRSAAAFNAAGIVMTLRNSPPLGGALAKSASGALDLVPVALVQNLARALSELRELGCTLIGLDGEGPGLLEDERLTGPTCIVMGAEGKGLRQLTRASCDRLCRIYTSGPLASLNVSTAAAVALHVCARKRAGLD